MASWASWEVRGAPGPLADSWAAEAPARRTPVSAGTRGSWNSPALPRSAEPCCHLPSQRLPGLRRTACAGRNVSCGRVNCTNSVSPEENLSCVNPAAENRAGIERTWLPGLTPCLRKSHVAPSFFQAPVSPQSAEVPQGVPPGESWRSPLV